MSNSTIENILSKIVNHAWNCGYKKALGNNYEEDKIKLKYEMEKMLLEINNNFIRPPPFDKRILL